MRYEAKIADLLAFSFTIVIVIFAASGPLNEFVRWFIEATNATLEEFSRREQRMLFKEHWLGAFHRAFERSFLLPTGIILGLPLILSFAISFLNVRAASWLHWVGLAMTIAVFSAWIGKLFAVDEGALPSADSIVFWVFPLAVALTLYLTWKQFGNLDMSMTSPVVYNLMSGGKAMYAKQADAPELAKNVNLLMWYPYGAYHFAVRADSDIQTLDDIEGASVFLGPQGGGAFNAAKGWVASTTGLVAGEDYEAIKANWQTGYQAFLDGKIDVYVNGCLDPCGQFIQFTETEDVRFIAHEDHTGEAVDKFLGKFRYYAEVPSGVYEGQKNDGPVMGFDTAVGIAAPADMDEDTVYQLSKAFWDNIDEEISEAPWAKALNLEFAASKRGLAELHPGAARYYREVGVLK